MAWRLYTGKRDRLDIGDGKTISAKRAYIDESGDAHTRRQFIKHTRGITPEVIATRNKERIATALSTGQLVTSPNLPASKRGVLTKLVDPITGEPVSRKEALERIRETGYQWKTIGEGGVPDTGGYLGADDRYAPLALKYATTHNMTQNEFRELLNGTSEISVSFKELSVLLDQVRFGGLSENRKQMVYKRIRVMMHDLDFDESSDYHDAFYM